MSTQILISFGLGGSGTTTFGETHGVAWSCSTVFTAFMRFNFCDVIQLRMDPEEPSATLLRSSAVSIQREALSRPSRLRFFPIVLRPGRTADLP